MVLSVLICTLNEGIKDVARILLPEREDVNYVVSFQYTDDSFLALIPHELTQRKDVFVSRLKGKGLSRNRNNALMHSKGDISLIADDDVRYKNEYFNVILSTFRENQNVDIALFKAKTYDGAWMKEYPDYSYGYQEAPKGTYPCSCEIVMRKSVYDGGIRFDERFGLGSDYLSSGEEDVLLEDALRKGLKIVYFPELIVETDCNTTGLRLLHDKRVQRSKGAVFYYCYGYRNALYRCARESVYYLLHSFSNPFSLFKNMYDGIDYCRITNKDI